MKMTNENRPSTGPNNQVHRTGRWSKEEMAFIKDNARKFTLKELAAKLNRLPETLREYLNRNNIATSDADEGEMRVKDIKLKLRLRSYWPEIVRQLYSNDEVDEVDYFENQWALFYLQFDEEVTPTEELQMRQLIMLDILMNRNAREHKRQLETLERYQGELNEAQKVPKEERTQEEKSQIHMLDSIVRDLRVGMTGFSNERTKLQDQTKQLFRDLKSTRDVRMKNIETSKTNWVSLLRSLEDEQTRESAGREAALVKLAAQKVLGDLSKFHTFLDGEIDQPLLTPETVRDEEEEET